MGESIYVFIYLYYLWVTPGVGVGVGPIFILRLQGAGEEWDFQAHWSSAETKFVDITFS